MLPFCTFTNHFSALHVRVISRRNVGEIFSEYTLVVSEKGVLIRNRRRSTLQNNIERERSFKIYDYNSRRDVD